MLPLLINGQSPKHHDRYRIGHVAAYVSWRVAMSNAACSQSVIADYRSIMANHEGAGCTGNFVLEGAAFEPFVEHWYAT